MTVSKKCAAFASSFAPRFSTNYKPAVCKSVGHDGRRGHRGGSEREPVPRRGVSREVVRAGSLEESKKRARSQYDNIPDLNQQYIAELGRMERKYGRKRADGRSVADEAQRSILASDSRNKAVRKRSAQQQQEQGETLEEGEEEENTDPDLSGYGSLRNRLLGDTVTVGALAVCAAWMWGTPRDAASVALGVAAGVGYVVLLARGVERLATRARETRGAGGAADGLQAARVGLLAAVVVGAARRGDSVNVLLVVLGFFSYKVATLLPLVTGEAFDDA